MGRLHTAKQTCIKVGDFDGDILVSDAPPSLCGTCNLDVDGVWQVQKRPKKMSSAWCLLGYSRTAFKVCTGQGNRAFTTHGQGCRFEALQDVEAPESENRMCIVCGVDNETFRLSSSSAGPMCGSFWRPPCELPRLATASGQRPMETTLKTSRLRSGWKCVRQTVSM